jgi:hypothetical protein
LDAFSRLTEGGVVGGGHHSCGRVELLSDADGGGQDRLLLTNCGLGLGCWVMAHLLLLSMWWSASIALCTIEAGLPKRSVGIG